MNEWRKKMQCAGTVEFYSASRMKLCGLQKKTNKQMEITICRKINWLRETNTTQILYWHIKSPVGTGHELRSQPTCGMTGTWNRKKWRVDAHSRRTQQTCVGISLCEIRHCAMYIIIPKKTLIKNTHFPKTQSFKNYSRTIIQKASKKSPF